MNWLLIGIGGSLGAISRYAIGHLLEKQNSYFPISTFIVNALGSFLLGYIIGHNIIQETQNIYYLVAGGFLGAFTTFSTFSYELFDLIKTNQMIKAFIFITLHLLVILITGMFGFFLNI